MSNLSYSVVIILVLLNWLLAGCTSLPNTSGYTTASIQLKQAVVTTGNVVEQELLSAIEVKAINIDQNNVNEFQEAWSATNGVLDAMVVHAQSIEQIVDAGKKGEDSARNIANSVEKLVKAIDVAFPAKPGVDTVVHLYSEYSRYVAGKSLEETLDKSGPIIANISKLVEENLKDAGRLFNLQIEAQVQELDVQFGEWNTLHDRFSTHALEAVKNLESIIKDKEASDIEKAEAMTKMKDELKFIENGLKMIEPHLAEYKAIKKAILRRKQAGNLIFGAAENAITAWGATHQQLATAVKERKIVSVESLTTTVVEIRSLIQRWREL